MTGAIGYYVHHHGRGHLERALAIAGKAPERFTLIGTGLADLPASVRTLDLPDDRHAGEAGFAGADGAEPRPDALHYAPVRHGGVRRRTSAIAQWIACERPALMVIDVSVEAAMLARLCSTPTVYVRLAGDRSDPAHLDAFRGARRLIAPFHQDLEDGATVGWIRRKSVHCAGLTTPRSSGAPDPNVALVVLGRGGSSIDGGAFAEVARATPEVRWRVIGWMAAPADPPENLSILGWVDDAAREIAGAGVVIAGAGDGVLNAIAAAGRPYVCIPEPRPYDEQRAKGRRLRALGAAVVLDAWPAPTAWRAVLDAARRLDLANVARLHDPDGPAKAAAFLLEAASQ